MAKKAKSLSFKKGTGARAARSKAAEDLKARGVPASIAFAEATSIVKKVKSSAARKRLAKHGLRASKGK